MFDRVWHGYSSLGILLLFVIVTSYANAQENAEPPTKPEFAQVPVAQPEESYINIPMLSPGKQLTLDEAIAAADSRNLTLNGARLEIKKAEAQLSQAWGLVIPVAQGGVQYIRNDHEDTLNFGDSLGPIFEGLGMPAPEVDDMIIRPQDILVGNIQVMVPLINFQSWYTISVAKKGVELAELSIEDARQQILLVVTQAYFVSVMTNSLIELHKAQLVAATHHLETAKERHAAGMGIRIDVVRAEADVEKERQRLLVAHRAFDNARDALGFLTGVDGLPMPVEPPPIKEPSGLEDELTSNAMNSHAGVRAKNAATQLADRQLNMAWMQFLPTLSAGGQFQYQFTDPPDLGSDDQSRWAAMLTLTVPIYNHFRYGDLDHRRASLQQAQINEQDTQGQVALKVRKTRRDYLTALSIVETAERQANLASEALTLVEESYKAGTGSSLEVTDARRNSTAANVNLAAQQLKAQIALLTLLRTIGEDLTKLPFQSAEK